MFFIKKDAMYTMNTVYVITVQYQSSIHQYYICVKVECK